MTPEPPPIVRLSDLKPRQRGTFFALLVERNQRKSQGGRSFYHCRFRDPRRSASCLFWDEDPLYAACDEEWFVGQFFKIQAVYTEHEKFGPQIDVIKIRPVKDEDAADGFKPSDFIDVPRCDATQLFAQLRAEVESGIADEPLRRLTLGLLDRFADILKVLPATPRHYYPYSGGWVEHTLAVVRNSAWLADRYRERFADLKPPLNRDVVMASAALHEIGRAVELEPSKSPANPAEQTIEGRLFGHIFLGRDLIREAAKVQADLHPELLRLVDHVVVSHLTLPEWGSPRLPMIPEVLIIHHADDLDAKMEMYVRCLTKDGSPTAFTDRDPMLNRQLYKGREK